MPTNSILSFPPHIMYISDDSISNKQTYGVYLFHVVKEIPTCLTICWFSYHSCRVLCGQQTKSPTKSPSRFPTKTPTDNPVSCVIFKLNMSSIANTVNFELFPWSKWFHVQSVNSISDRQTCGVYHFIVWTTKQATKFIVSSFHLWCAFCQQQTKSPTNSPTRMTTIDPTVKPVSNNIIRLFLDSKCDFKFFVKSDWFHT